MPSDKGPRTTEADQSGDDVTRRGRDRRMAWLAAAVIIAAGAAAYWNSFSGVFVFDDLLAIRDNEHIRNLWPLSEAMSVDRWNTGETVDGRPILSFSLAVNHALLGGEPWGYHVGNLAIHICAALALFGIIRRSLRCDRLRDRYGPTAAWLALAAALIWLVHPLQTESVTYIVQRAESQMGLLFLLTLYCAIRGFQAERRAWSWYVPAVLACWLGQATKEVIAVAPVVVLVYDWLLVSRSLRATLRRRWWLYVALGGSWAVAVALLKAAPMAIKQDMKFLGVWQYAPTQPAAVLRYLWLAFWPRKLAIAYEWPAADHVLANPAGGIVVLSLLALTAWGLWRRKPLAFLGVWFFAVLAPSSSFIPLRQTIHEHRMYLPLAAVAVLVVIGAEHLLRRLVSSGRTSRPVARALAATFLVAVLAALGYRTGLRNKDYHSEFVLWSANVRDRPQSGTGHANLAGILMGWKQFAKAVPHLEKAIEFFGEQPVTTMPLGWIYHNLGTCHFRLGHTHQALRYLEQARTEQWEHAVDETKPTKPIVYDMLCLAHLQAGNLDKAEKYGRMAVELGPAPAEAHSNLAMVFERKGQLAKAISHYRTAVSIRPNKAALHNNLGVALRRDRKMAEAIRELQKAVSLEPGKAMFHRNLALAFLQDARFGQAASCFETVVSIQPNSSRAHADLAFALNKAGKASEAVGHYERAVALDGNNFMAVTNLAWLLATSDRAEVRNGQRAMELASRACMRSRTAMTLNILAAAQAEAGDFAEAVRTQQQAIDLLDPSHTVNVKAYRRRLAMYRRRRPYREPSGK